MNLPPHTHTPTAHPRVTGPSTLNAVGLTPLLDVEPRGLAWPLPRHLVCGETFTLPYLTLPHLQARLEASLQGQVDLSRSLRAMISPAGTPRSPRSPRCSPPAPPAPPSPSPYEAKPAKAAAEKAAAQAEEEAKEAAQAEEEATPVGARKAVKPVGARKAVKPVGERLHADAADEGVVIEARELNRSLPPPPPAQPVAAVAASAARDSSANGGSTCESVSSASGRTLGC